MALPKEHNRLYSDFNNAYWAIDKVSYTVESVSFKLLAYPSRDAKLANRTTLAHPSIGYGEPYGGGTVDCVLYKWSVVADVTEIFPSGVIPAGRDAQYTAIYLWVKRYTSLPFEDVFE